MSYLTTYTGKKFFPLETKSEDIEIIDIAHALSLVCRFGGHVNKFHSVAQHSVIVSDILPDELKMWGLLHDAAEAYIADIPRPAKEHLPQYHDLEDGILKAVAKKFGLVWPMPKQVKDADNIVLVTEARDLMNIDTKKCWAGIYSDIEPLSMTIESWSSDKAKAMFLETFFKECEKRLELAMHK
jgi:5'-deoxynucleotidase YfbR-like HD superfamily hydrolase